MDADRAEVETDNDLTSGYLVRRYGVSLRTLRFYEEKGLLAPKRLGDIRLFSSRDIVRVELILAGRKLGLSLDEIGSLIESHLVEKQATKTQVKVTQDFVALQKQLSLLEAQKTGLEAAIAELNARLFGKASATDR